LRLHVDPGYPLIIGTRCTIGHKAMLHGCTIGDGSLVGMRATVLNGARIGRNCLIGAGALVTEGTEIPNGSLVVGMAAKVKCPLSHEAIEALAHCAQKYVWNKTGFRDGLKPCSFFSRPTLRAQPPPDRTFLTQKGVWR